MRSLKIFVCGAMLMLMAPIAIAHPAKQGDVHRSATGMKCSAMHAHMHGARRAKAHHAQSRSANSGMMQGDMKCMSPQPRKAPPAPASKASSPPQHDHDHTGAQPPK